MTNESLSYQDCQRCQELMNGLIDDELSSADAVFVRGHIADCDACADLFTELLMIVRSCSGISVDEIEEIAPPNSEALWKRIHNVLEAEKAAGGPAAKPKKTWGLSFFQLSSALASVAIVSSILTIVALRSYNAEPDAAMLTRSVQDPSLIDRVLVKLGLAESPAEKLERKLRDRQIAIDYWNAKVQSRRMQWDRATREAFDRNLKALDEAANDYRLILQKDPEDQLSEEMLDAVLNDKMNLLRDFASL